MDNGDDSKIPELNSVEEDIASFLSSQARAAQVRSRAQYIEQGERSTAYFFGLEKKRAAARQISAMRTQNGSVITDLNDILDSWKSFYQKLYSSEGTDYDTQTEMLEFLNMTLSAEQSESCDGLLTNEECYSALKGMAKNKLLVAMD